MLGVLKMHVAESTTAKFAEISQRVASPAERIDAIVKNFNMMVNDANYDGVQEFQQACELYKDELSKVTNASPSVSKDAGVGFIDRINVLAIAH
jgi:hypothetical protein